MGRDIVKLSVSEGLGSYWRLAIKTGHYLLEFYGEITRNITRRRFNAVERVRTQVARKMRCYTVKLSGTISMNIVTKYFSVSISTNIVKNKL